MHWMVVKRITRYLNGTLDFKLCLESNNIALRGFCDGDWAGDANNRRYEMIPRVSCWPWNHFMKMQETTNHCIV